MAENKRVREVDVAVLGARQIYELAEKRMKDAAATDRLHRYSILADYYYGATGDRTAGSVFAMNPAGQPVLRSGTLGESLDVDRKYISNLCQPIVDDYQALVGQLPQVRVPAPNQEESGQVKAEKLTKYMASTYEISDMVQHHAEFAWCLSTLGDACYLAEIAGDGPQRDRVLLQSIDPRYAFPGFLSGAKRFELYDLIVAYVLAPDQIKATFGVEADSDKEEDCTVLTYITRLQRTVVVGKGRATEQHVVWRLDEIPAVWTFNKQVGRHCQSDIASVLGLQDYYDFAYNVAADAIVESTYPITHVVDRERFGEGPMAMGPGEYVESSGGGEIRRIAPSTNPGVALDMADRARKDLYLGTGTTPVRQSGEMNSSIQTGRAMQHSQAPQATRLDLKLAVIGAAMEKANSRLLMTQEQAPLIKEAEFEIYGRLKGREFRVDFNPVKDIDGWRRNAVTFDRNLGTTSQQKIVMSLQGLQGKLFDRRHGMEMIGIEDPDEMMQRIDADTLHQARIEAEAQKLLQGAQQPGPGTGGAGGPGGPGGAAPTGGSAPPPPVYRPPQMAQAAGATPPPAVPQGVTLAEVRAQIAPHAERLRGEVFAVGDLALMGMSTKPRLAITEYQDYGAIVAAVPGAEVKAMSEEKMPPLKELVS